MFYNVQSHEEKEKYIEALTLIGNLSNLFSDSKVPYLYYRVAEKTFCQAFHANDLSRSDIALDAAKNNVGIGLKTFLANNNKTFQKVAEFNKDRELYQDKTAREIINIISNLRNQRIKFAENLSDVDSSIYHCVVREENNFCLYEENMDYIDMVNISNVVKNKNSITFNDGKHEYNFNLSKSTLLKRFNTQSNLTRFEVQIFDNPLEKIKECFSGQDIISDLDTSVVESVYLPLYGKDKQVPEKSGLNQWNARGRERNINEVYIPIPAKVHRCSPGFFPPRDEPFDLILPNGHLLNAKVCQDNSKALMSNPNSTLGQWILRDVLGLNEGEVLTYERLRLIGIDTVKVDKLKNGQFRINFVGLGSYDDYMFLCQ